MQAYRLHVIVPESRKVLIEFPDSIPPGEVELIVLVPDEEATLSELPDRLV